MKKKFLTFMIMGLCALIAFSFPQVTLALDPPARPTNLTATALNTSEIEFSWSTVSGATSYDIFRATSSSGNYDFIDSVTARRYTDTDLTANRTYYYKVQAVNSEGTSTFSAVASASTGSSFSSLTAKAVGSGQIYLSWKSVSSTSSYVIHRSTSSSGTYTEVATTNLTNYTDGGLTLDRTYYYKVTAISSSGSSTTSNIADAKAGNTRAASSRLAGSNRYETSAKIAQSGWDGSSYYAVVVSGENYPDALCSAPLAAKHNAPILLTSRTSLDAKTRSELSRLSVQNVFLIGGTGVIAPSVEQELKNMGITVTRIAGSNRYETSLKVAETLGYSSQVIVATGEDFADALSIAPIAGLKQMPILLTSKDSVSSGLKQYLNNNAGSVYVVGGTGVVGNTVFNQLPSAKRLSGSNRYETNVNILKEFANDLSLSNCYLATGLSFPDALAGSALASLSHSPILLVSNPLDAATAKYIKDNSADIGKYTVLGGTGVVAENVISNITNSSISAPSAPANLSATARSASQIYLSWSTVSDATSYEIYRSTSSSGTYSLITKAQSTSYTNTGLAKDTRYYYKIKAVNSAGVSPFSATVNAMTSTNIAPSIPLNVAATAKSKNQITLTWSAVSGATSYDIYRSSSSSSGYSYLAETTSTSYTNSGLSENTTYYYRVVAVNNSGESAYSAVASAKTFAGSAPAAPDDLTAKVLSSTQIALSWSETDRADSYLIYRATSASGNYTLIRTQSGTSYTDSGLAANTTYYYKIRASNSVGTSAYTAVVSAGTGAANVPAAPANPSATALTGDRISVSWSTVNGAESYEIYRSTSASGTYERLTTVSAPPYIDTDYETNKTYYYKIRARNSKGTGPYSATVTVQTAPAAPDGLTAIADSPNQVTLTWDAVKDAESYTIYRSTDGGKTYTDLPKVTASPYTDTGLTAKRQYYYKVSANKGTLSTPSGAVSVTTP